MQYGFIIPNGDIKTAPDLAAEAEAAGWDGVFIEDYIVYQGKDGTSTCDPWVALTAMALRTKQILLGTSVTPLPRRRPWKLARETVSVDHLSHGRLILPVGLGTIDDGGFRKVGEPTDRKTRGKKGESRDE